MCENKKTSDNDIESWMKRYLTITTLGYGALILLLFLGTLFLTQGSLNDSYHHKFDPPQLSINIDTIAAKQIDTISICKLQVAMDSISHRQYDWHEGYLSDLRQESNNNINKYNGWLSFWIALITILLGVVPIYFNYRFERAHQERIDRKIKVLKEEFDETLKEKERKLQNLKDELAKAETDMKQLLLQNSASCINAIRDTKIFSDTFQRNSYWHIFLTDFQSNLRTCADDFIEQHSRILACDMKPLREMLVHTYYVLNLWSSNVNGKSQTKTLVRLMGEITDLLAYVEPVPPENWWTYYNNYYSRFKSIIDRVIELIKEKV